MQKKILPKLEVFFSFEKSNYDLASSFLAEQHDFFPDEEQDLALASEHPFFSVVAGVAEASAVVEYFSVLAFDFFAFLGSCALTFIVNKKATTANIDTTFFILFIF